MKMKDLMDKYAAVNKIMAVVVLALFSYFEKFVLNKIKI